MIWIEILRCACGADTRKMSLQEFQKDHAAHIAKIATQKGVIALRTGGIRDNGHNQTSITP